MVFPVAEKDVSIAEGRSQPLGSTLDLGVVEIVEARQQAAFIAPDTRIRIQPLASRLISDRRGNGLLEQNPTDRLPTVPGCRAAPVLPHVLFAIKLLHMKGMMGGLLVLVAVGAMVLAGNAMADRLATLTMPQAKQEMRKTMRGVCDLYGRPCVKTKVYGCERKSRIRIACIGSILLDNPHGFVRCDSRYSVRRERGLFGPINANPGEGDCYRVG